MQRDADFRKGFFTLPGEAGYEELTLQLAEKWGADAIRDSDGTKLSEKIVSSGYDIYSTICLVRMDNEWAKANRDKLQQTFLMSFPVIAKDSTVQIDPLKGYFREQFTINANEDSVSLWQVFDRTTGEEVPRSQWTFDAGSGIVTVNNVTKWHKYTVNFLAYRIWDEISMYNHITNDWGDKEHLMVIDPIYPEAQEHILSMLEKWLIEHPKTKIVRFTSMFYNFCWFWGDDPNLRHIFTDWASYDFAVSPYALKEFEKVKGYSLTSEDFVNKGLHNATHNVPSKRYLDWIDFVNQFVVSFGRKCIDLVHKYGKKAYVFYDDHWIGVEPYSERFKDFNFDGLIKCVFNAFEARLCAGVKDVAIHELRLHPYLFPTGLGGEPTFKEGGNPKRDAQNFWIKTRRALLRQPVDRIGLGGYLHLVQDFPDFVDYIEELAIEFRKLKSLHENGKPYTAPFKVAILTAWGKLRSWSCSGHMHEHPELELIRVIECLAGLPIDVEFINFEDIVNDRIPEGVKVIINAGRLDSAWSGGDNWKNPKVIEKLTDWVANGGGFIGVGEPSAAKHSSQYFQMSHVLGVDREIGLSICKAKYSYKVCCQGSEKHFIMKDFEGVPDFDKDIDNVFVLDGNTKVLADRDGSPVISVRDFEKGRAVYLSGYKVTPQNIRLLHRAIYWAAGCEDSYGIWTCDNYNTECAYFPESNKLVVVNNTEYEQHTAISGPDGKRAEVKLPPYGMEITDI